MQFSLDVSNELHEASVQQKCPNCFVTQVCGKFAWSKWMNRDRPSGSGDWENVSLSKPLGGCLKPVLIECRTATPPYYNWW